MTTQTVAPVRRDITVRAGQQRAFETFTARMGAWWNPEHHLGDAPLADVVIEPREGGRWYEVDTAGGDCTWGQVLDWSPFARVVLAWQLDGEWKYDPDFRTELEIRFVSVDERTTRVELEHRDLDRYGENAERIRAQLDAEGGWQGLLTRFSEGLESA